MTLCQVFVGYCDEHDAKLAATIGKLDGAGKGRVEELLLRLNGRQEKDLSPTTSRLAVRAMRQLHRVTLGGIERLLAVFDFFDTNQNKEVDGSELGIVVEILEAFSKADSNNNTLSNKELDMLLAVLRHRDTDSDGHLTTEEVTEIRDGLWEPSEFLAAEKKNNPLVRALL